MRRGRAGEQCLDGVVGHPLWQGRVQPCLLRGRQPRVQLAGDGHHRSLHEAADAAPDAQRALDHFAQQQQPLAACHAFGHGERTKSEGAVGQSGSAGSGGKAEAVVAVVAVAAVVAMATARGRWNGRGYDCGGGGAGGIAR